MVCALLAARLLFVLCHIELAGLLVAFCGVGAELALSACVPALAQ